MKKLMLLMMGSAILATSSIAQDVSTQAPPAAEVKITDMKQQRAEWDKKIKEELKLTSDQATKFEALSKEYNEKIDAVLADASLTKELQKEKKMALKKEKEAKLMELFSTEQQAKYKELTEKKKKEVELKPA